MSEAKIVAWAGPNHTPALEVVHREQVTAPRRFIYPRRSVESVTSATVDGVAVELSALFVDQHGRRVGLTRHREMVRLRRDGLWPDRRHPHQETVADSRWFNSTC